MKKTTLTTIVFVLIFGVIAYAKQAEPATPDPWPRSTERLGVKYTVYQPQPDSWDGFILKAHTAVAIQAQKEPQPTYGVIFFQARTLVDRDERMVHFEDFRITEAKFPSAPDMAQTYLDQTRKALPEKLKSVSLDRIEASMAVLEQQKKTQVLPLKNDPPKIIFSKTPSLLVFIDGEPRFTPVKDSDLVRVLNTRVLLVKDATGKLYLRVFDGWMESQTFKGPWAVSAKTPKDMKKALAAARESKQVDLLEGAEDIETKTKPSLKKIAPVVFVTVEPTELIMTEGEPNFVPLQGTQLLYVKNTSGNIFKNLVDQKTYILVSGRWFKADSFAGPWQYVPGSNLPADFARIPDDSPKENVKASVPGTRQANEAVIASTIPQTAKIDRKKTKFTPQIDGEPKLMPVKGTPLFHIVNSSYPIIKVAEDSWFACANGVWFVARSLKGPWAVADSIPAVIYSIPPSSSIYYVTFVRISTSTPDYVYVGYTSGYYGSYVTADNVVVNGTGYYYTPWYGTYWYGPPVTYGYGCSMCWTPWYGWSYGYGFGWWYGYYPPAPYWGPYYGWGYNTAGGITAWGPGGWASTTGNVYHQWGSTSAVTRGATGYNAYTGNQWSTKYGMAYNSTTGTLATGREGSVQNVYTGGYATGKAGTVTSPSKGVTVSGGKVTAGNVNTGKEVTAGKITVTGPEGQTGSAAGIKGEQGSVGRVGDNAIATKDGNVYVNKGGEGWNQVTRPEGSPKVQPQQLPQNLDREQQARNMGQQRADSYQANRPAGGWGGTPRGSYGGARGGGARGGGMRR